MLSTPGHSLAWIRRQVNLMYKAPVDCEARRVSDFVQRATPTVSEVGRTSAAALTLRYVALPRDATIP